MGRTYKDAEFVNDMIDEIVQFYCGRILEKNINKPVMTEKNYENFQTFTNTGFVKNRKMSKWSIIVTILDNTETLRIMNAT